MKTLGIASLTLAVATLATGSLPTFAQTPDTFKVYASNLQGPRGLRFGPDGSLYLADAGTGGKTATTTKDCVLSVQAVDRFAARTGIALVAGGPGRIAKIRTPRPLKHVAAERRHVAKLSARGLLQALSNDRIVF